MEDGASSTLCTHSSSVTQSKNLVNLMTLGLNIRRVSLRIPSLLIPAVYETRIQ